MDPMKSPSGPAMNAFGAVEQRAPDRAAVEARLIDVFGVDGDAGRLYFCSCLGFEVDEGQGDAAAQFRPPDHFRDPVAQNRSALATAGNSDMQATKRTAQRESVICGRRGFTWFRTSGRAML